MSFNCLCCGECCSGKMDIYLNIYDLYKITKHLGLINSKELFTKGYLSFSILENNVYRPIMKFKKKPYLFCPFLINNVLEDNTLRGYCSLHPDNKPLVCMLSPISRTFNPKNQESDFFLTKPTNHCPGYNKRLEINTFPYSNEILEEEFYYNILNRVKNEEFDYYKSKLYFFNCELSWNEIKRDIVNLFL